MKVYWDKGHGGSDPGAVGNGLQEKVLTHKIVEYGMAYLANYEVQQKASRNGDETKSLNQRTNDANAWGADLLMSVHINSAGSTTAKGFESFIFPNAGSQTISFQNILHAELMLINKAFGIDTDRGKKRANFHMVRESHMTAALTENLFISNVYDAKRLAQDEYLKAIGEAHARAAVKFLGLKEKAGVKQSEQELNGWHKFSSVWYYYENGTKKVGWLQYKNKWYYLEPSAGKMVTGKQTIGGKPYFFLPDGDLLITDEDGVIQ